MLRVLSARARALVCVYVFKSEKFPFQVDYDFLLINDRVLTGSFLLLLDKTIAIGKVLKVVE